MISIVYVDNLVLVMILLIMVELVRVVHVRMVISANFLILIMIMVVGSIFTFVRYYIRGDVSIDNFKLVITLFLILIVLILSSYRMLIFLR